MSTPQFRGWAVKISTDPNILSGSEVMTFVLDSKQEATSLTVVFFCFFFRFSSCITVLYLHSKIFVRKHYIDGCVIEYGEGFVFSCSNFNLKFFMRETFKGFFFVFPSFTSVRSG